jgi:FkbM family methyltransferase
MSSLSVAPGVQYWQLLRSDGDLGVTVGAIIQIKTRTPRAAHDAAALRTDLQAYLTRTRLTRSGSGDDAVLTIPGHRPFKWKPVKFSLRRPLQSRFYEETTTVVLSFLLQRLRPASFFDVGAAQAYFSRVAATCEACAPAIHAFEMRPQFQLAAQQWIDNEGLSQRVHAHLAGLSDVHEGMRDVWYARTKLFEKEPKFEDYAESAWVRMRNALLGRRAQRGIHRTRLLLTTIDEFAARRGCRPDLMKIDVDGYEGKVLAGARRMLQEHKPTIILELHKDAMQRDGYTRSSVVDLLLDRGYRALFLTDHHSLSQCEVVAVKRGDPLITRQETDLILFVP